jgi:hypothetical protein
MGTPYPANHETYMLVRRSSRANKGQHSKLEGGTARKKKKVDVVDDDEGEIRCLCGDNEDDGGFMIQCEMCNKWQHGECMGYEDEDEVQQSYACELCRPDLYKDVGPKAEETKVETTSETPGTSTTTKAKRKVAKQNSAHVFRPTRQRLMFKKKSMKRKTPPLDDEESDDNSVFSADDAEPLAPRKRSKTSASLQSTPPPGKSPSQDPKRKPPPIITTRRPSHQSPQQHQRRNSQSATPSTPAPVTKTPLATTFAVLSDVRRAPVARIFAKIFEPIDPSRAESLGLSIEQALYSAFPGYGSAEYKNKFRSISFNLKDVKNTSLRDRVLSGNLPPEELVKMSSEEMANQELREQAERIREEGVAQSVLKVQEGPRIRRTHKGEEIVGDESTQITTAEVVASAPFARAEERSPSVKAAEEDVPASPRSVGSNGSRTFVSPPPQTSKNISMDIPPERKSSVSNFDMSNVWSHLQSPTSQGPSHEHMELDTLSEEISQNQIDDPDIDRLLNDEPVDSPPYSPSAEAFELPDTSSHHPAIWTGTITMQSVANFTAQARFVGGPHSITDLPWSNILHPNLVIDGRIPIDTTTKYLDAQRVSSTKDIIVIQFEAAENSQKPMLQKLFQYFHDRQRYGVLQIHSQIVKDAYLIPLSANEPIPSQIQAMDSHEIPRSRSSASLLAILVIQKNVERSHLPVDPAPSFLASNSPHQEDTSNRISPAIPSTSFSPSTHTPPTVTPTVLESNTTGEGLGLSAADLAALQTILIAHPEILSNPQILTNPTILQNLLQQHLGGQNSQGW